MEALETAERPHPLSKTAALVQLKRYIAARESRIRLHDLLMPEVETVRERAEAALRGGGANWSDLAKATLQMDAASEVLTALMATGGYWGESDHLALWIKALERVSGVSVETGYTAWIKAARYPAQLAFYACGLAMMARNNEDGLADWLLAPRVFADGKEQPPALTLHVYAAIDNDAAKHLPDLAKRSTPMSDHLHEVLRPALADVLPDERVYSAAFDRFEYLVALAFIGVKWDSTEGTMKTGWGPVGRFAWRTGYDGTPAVRTLSQEVQRAGKDWFLLRRGLFGGSPDELSKAREIIDSFVTRIGL